MFKRSNNLLNTSVFILVIVFYLISEYYNINYPGMNADEGYYAIAAKYAMDGKVPYRDFAYPQTPIFPYLNGIIMKIIGYGQIEQSIANSIWGGLALVIFMSIVFIRSHLLGCFLCGWLLTVPPFLNSWPICCSGATYGAVNFFMALSCLPIILNWSYRKKVALFSIAGNLAIGCRLPVAPAVIVLYAFLFFQGQNFKEKAFAVLSFISVTAILFLPFYLADKESFIFWNLLYHLKSSFHRRIVSELILMFPGAIALMAVGISASLPQIRKRILLPETVILFSAMTGIIAQISLKCSYGIYSAPFIAPGIVGSLIILSKFQWHKYFFALVLFFPLMYLIPFKTSPDCLTFNKIHRDQTWRLSLDDATDFIKKNVPKNEKILTPFTILAVQSDRPVFDGMEMGPFAVTDEIEEERASALNLTHYDKLIRLVRDREPYAVILNNFASKANFVWSVPSLSIVDVSKRKIFFDQLTQNYQTRFNKYQLAILLRK